MIKTRTKELPEVDMTPMIDIVFQLIIFFMVVMAIAVVYGVAIKFPAGGTSPPRDQKKEKNIVVYVQSDWLDRDHYLHREGILKVNGEEIPLTVSDDRNAWEEERERGYNYLEGKMRELLEQGYKKDVMAIQGDMKTYHGKVLRVIDKGKGLGIDGFSLVPPMK